MHEDGADLGRQPPSENHHAVLVLIHVQRAAPVPSGGLTHLRYAVHPTPASHDAFDMIRCAGAPHRQEPLLGLRRSHASQGPDLGIRELSMRQGLGQPRQRPQGARHPDALASRPQVEPHAPGEPGRARAESSVPASAGIELADELEEAGGRGVEVGRQLGDLVTQAVERARVHGESPFCCWGDCTPEFRSLRGGTPSGDRGPIDSFSRTASATASAGVDGPLGRYLSEAAATR